MHILEEAQKDVYKRQVRMLLPSTGPLMLSLIHIFDELRARFGADIVPEGLSLENLPGRDALIRSVADSMRAASDEISPESLRGLLVDQGAPMMLKMWKNVFWVLVTPANS